MRAEAELDAVLDLELSDRERARVLKGYGDFRKRQGRFEEAARRYARAVELDRTFITARLALGGVLGHIGRFAQAADEYARVVS